MEASGHGGSSVLTEIEEAMEWRLEQRLEARLQAGLEAIREELSAELARIKVGPQDDNATKEEKEEGEEQEEKESGLVGAGCPVKLRDFSLSESIWDASVFLGMPQLGVGGSVLVGVALILNLLVQVIFCLIVRENFVNKEFTDQDLDGLRAWRLKVGHAERFVSTGGVSLVDRMCNEDLALELATVQTNKLLVIREYLPDLNPEATTIQRYLQGNLMCYLALLVWFFSISREVSSILDFLGAFRLLPYSPRTVITSTNDSFCLKSMSLARGALVFLLACVRLSIAIFLLIVGSYYLCYTTSMADLLLNAVALEMVVNIDEMVFYAMAPTVAMELVTQLEPLKMRPWYRFRSADARALFVPVMLAALLSLFGVFSLGDAVANLREAEEVLCGGNRSFSYSVDGLGFVHIHSLQSFNPADAYNLNSYTDYAVKEVRDGVPPEQWKYALFSEGSADSLVSTVSSIYSRRDAACHNALDPKEQLMDVYNLPKPATDSMRNQWRVWPRWLQQLLNRTEPITSCVDIKEYCFIGSRAPFKSRVFKMMRAMCPEECGCNSLISGSVATATEYGCPPVCDRVNADEKFSVPCEDIRSDVPSERLSNFMEWLKEFEQASGPSQNSTWGFRNIFLQGGCDFLVKLHPQMCDQAKDRRDFAVMVPPAFLKILTYMCPASCNCGGVRNPQVGRPVDDACPPACICNWPFEVAILESEVAPNCTVPFFGYTGVVSSPMSTDAQCCHTMQEMSKALAYFIANPSQTQNVSAALRFNRAAGALCALCRSRCFDTYANASYPSHPSSPSDTTADFAMRLTHQSMQQLFCHQTRQGRRLLGRHIALPDET